MTSSRVLVGTKKEAFLLEPGPAIRRHVKVDVDGDPADLATSVREGAVVHILPAVSGGR